jgi:hypothetical protein
MRERIERGDWEGERDGAVEVRFCLFHFVFCVLCFVLFLSLVSRCHLGMNSLACNFFGVTISGSLANLQCLPGHVRHCHRQSSEAGWYLMVPTPSQHTQTTPLKSQALRLQTRRRIPRLARPPVQTTLRSQPTCFSHEKAVVERSLSERSYIHAISISFEFLVAEPQPSNPTQRTPQSQ